MQFWTCTGVAKRVLPQMLKKSRKAYSSFAASAKHDLFRSKYLNFIKINSIRRPTGVLPTLLYKRAKRCHSMVKIWELDAGANDYDSALSVVACDWSALRYLNLLVTVLVAAGWKLFSLSDFWNITIYIFTIWTHSSIIAYLDYMHPGCLTSVTK